MPEPGTVSPEQYLEAREVMLEIVKEVLAKHRPQRIPEHRVVTCTRCYDDAPHEVIKTQWPGWREHVAPFIVDALLEWSLETNGA